MFIIVLEIRTGTTWEGFQLPGDPESLVIKKYKFSKSASKGFLAVHNPKEIQGMLDLMLCLQLEHYTLPQEDSLLEDSCMLEIKASSNPEVAKSIIHINSLKKVNTCFSQFVIDYLSIQLAFDNWYPFAAQGTVQFLYVNYLHDMLSST